MTTDKELLELAAKAALGYTSEFVTHRRFTKKNNHHAVKHDGCFRHYQAGLRLVLSRYFKRACRVLAAFNWWPVLNSGFGKIRANVQVHQPTHSPNGY